jgi:hypothetical protein
VERFADGDELERTGRQLQILCSLHKPSDVRNAASAGFLFADGNHLGLDIHSQHAGAIGIATRPGPQARSSSEPYPVVLA